MKRKLISLLALTLFVVPLTACGEDEKTPTYNINVKLEKAATDSDIDFNVNDCARVSGGGVYEQGTSASLYVETSGKRCEFVGWKLDGSGNYEGTNKRLWLNNITASHQVSAVIKLNNSNELKKTIVFKGLTKEGSDTPYALNEYKFPNMTTTGNTATTSQIKKNSIEFDGERSLNKVLFDDTTENTAAVDLRHVYLLEGSEYKFKENALKWQKGRYTSTGTCNFDIPDDITDINNMSISENTCIRAIIDTNEVQTNVKAEAFKNLLLRYKAYGNDTKDYERYVYVGIGTNGVCNTISENCTFVQNVGYFNDPSSSQPISYYGFTDNGLLEAIIQESNGPAYYICSVTDLDDCRNNTYTMTYSGYESLRIASLIDALNNVITGGYQTSSFDPFTEIKYSYDYASNKVIISQFKYEETLYTFNIVSNKHSENHLGVGQSANTAIKFKATIDPESEMNETDEKLLSQILTSMENDKISLVFKKNLSDEEIKTAIRTKIYSLVSANSETNNALRNYIYEITVDKNQNQKKLVIKPESAKKGSDLVTKDFLKINNGEDNEKYYYKGETLDGLGYTSSLIAYSKAIATDLSDLVIEDIRIDTDTDTKTIIYTILDAYDTKYEIHYSNGMYTLKDTTKDTTLEYVDGTITEYTLDKISSVKEVFGVDMVQTITTQTGSIKTLIGEYDALTLGFVIDESAIKEVHGYFFKEVSSNQYELDGTFYKIDDDLIIFVKSSGKASYMINIKESKYIVKDDFELNLVMVTPEEPQE